MAVTSRNAESRLRVSRRGFLKASGVGAAVAATASIGSVPYMASAARQQGWDGEYDVIVVGSGNAAFVSAITAKAEGSDVIMLEKGGYLGGTTLVSGGTAWLPNNPRMREEGIEDPKEDALKYMARYSWPHLYNPDSDTLGLTQEDYDLISTYFDTAGEAAQYLEDQGAITWRLAQGLGPDFDQFQYDYMERYEENVQPTHRSLQPTNAEGTNGHGADMINGYAAWAKENGIRIHLYHRVENVITNSKGEIIGVEVAIVDPGMAATAEAESAAEPEWPTISMRARKGVIFGTGGFARNEDMMHNLMPSPYYGGCAAPTNEGDLLRIATTLGARLGNLHNVWRNEGIFEQAVASAGAFNCIWYYHGDSFLMVNKTGKRFVNEKRPYQDRPMAHQDWDANLGDWTSRLSFFVYDQRLQDNWGGTFPLPKDPDTTPYIIKADTLEELADAINERVESLREVTGNVSLHADFKETFLAEVDKFNGYAREGVDPDFQRGVGEYERNVPFGPLSDNANIEYPSADQENVAMYPLSDEGPYYAFIVAQSAVDTNGGPVINTDSQITRWDGSAIEGLYGAGNCVSNPSRNAYWGGGATLGQGHVWGYRAGKHAAASPEKSAD